MAPIRKIYVCNNIHIYIYNSHEIVEIKKVYFDTFEKLRTCLLF